MDLFEDSGVSKVILSVSEFIEYVNLVIGRKKVIVEGEVSSYTLNQGKWVFFDLKDENSKAQCFSLSYTIRVQIEDGMRVRVTGTPRLHQKTGRFSIFVESVELAGEGSLKRAFELTKQKLEKEGLFASERKREIELFPRRIGLIASRESAAYTDFMRIINERWGGLEVYLYHCNVQGNDAVSSIVKGFEWFAAHEHTFGVETLVLIRGGGSLEDLQAFNSETVVRAIFASPIPVICGVGHERDETLADFVCDVRAATPTHAAQLVVPNRDDILRIVLNSCETLNASILHSCEWHSQRITHHMLILKSATEKLLQNFKHLLVRFKNTYQSLKVNIVHIGEQIRFFEKNLDYLNPLNVLQRGYSVVRTKGKIVSSMKDVSKGDIVDIRLSDGSKNAEIL